MSFHPTAPRFPWRPGLAAALLAASLLALAACGDSGPVGAELSALAGGDQQDVLDDLSALEPYHPEDILDIAYGEADGVRWRLFVWAASPDALNGLLCLLTSQSPDREPECQFELEAFFGPPPDLGLPWLTEGTPRFAFGSLGPKVVRVEVEIDAGQPVEAEIVGERRAHYVVPLPQEVSPGEVVAYDAEGHQLARRPFATMIGPMGDGFHYFDNRCDYTDDVPFFCEGGVTAGGVVGGNGPQP